MPAWLLAIQTILGVVGTVVPLVEKLLSGFGTFVSSEITKLFGTSAGGASTYLDGLITQIEDGIQLFDTGATDVAKEIEALWPDLQSLLNAFPGLGQSLLLRKQVIDDTGLSHGSAAKLVEAAHANVRTKAAAAARP